MSQKFSNIGILDGEIIEANEISQSVDAFMKLKAYDIIISGSLTVTGSINITGSFGGSGELGQFSRLGIGTPAPVDSEIHIKTTSGTGDPIILVEAQINSSPKIKLQNPDTIWSAGLSSGIKGIPQTSFVIENDGNFPVIIRKDSGNDVLNLTEGVFAVGPVGFTPGTLTGGSMMVNKNISGSLLKTNKIFATSSTPNFITLWGTASFASEIALSNTASYIESIDIDFSQTISNATSPNNNSQINTNTLASLTGSTGILKVSDISGIAIKDSTSDKYFPFITGSTEPNNGICFLGNSIVSSSLNSTYLKINQVDDVISLNSLKTDASSAGGSTNLVVGDLSNPADLQVKNNLIVSGSVGGSTVNTLQVGPLFDGSTFYSSSLGINDLFLNNRLISYIYNNNQDALSNTTNKLAFQAGASPAEIVSNPNSSAFVISSSKDIDMRNGSMNHAVPLTATGLLGSSPRSIIELGGIPNNVDYFNAILEPYIGTYTGAPVTTNANNATFITFDDSAFLGSFSDKIINFKLQAIGTPVTGVPSGVYIEQEYTWYYDEGTNQWEYINQNGTTIIRRSSNNNYNQSRFGWARTDNNSNLLFRIIPFTYTATDWLTWVEVQVGTNLGPP